MTCPLHAKIGPIEGGMGHAKPSGSSVRYFVIFDIDAAHFLTGRSPLGQPNNEAFFEAL